MIYLKLRKAAARFKHDEKGNITVEVAIMLPALLMVFLTLWSIFHAYRQHSISQKAGYTIGDMLSRETNPIDREYMVGTQKLLQYLTLSQLNDTTLRVSSINYNLAADEYQMNWSKVQGTGQIEFTDDDVEGLGNSLPIMKDGEDIILVETWIDYDPPFATGLGRHDITNFIFTRPRFAPNFCWDQCGG